MDRVFIYGALSLKSPEYEGVEIRENHTLELKLQGKDYV